MTKILLRPSSDYNKYLLGCVEESFTPLIKFHTFASSILVNTDGYLLEQQVPIHPCKTPRAILFILSINGAPK